MNWRRLVTILAVPIIAGSYLASRMAPPVRSSIPGSPLAPCPSSPNCVCSGTPIRSTTSHPSHSPGRLPKPWPGYDASWNPASNHGGHCGSRPPSGGIPAPASSDSWMTWNSAWMPPSQLIHVRSGSRIGYSDFGTNRRRWDHIRAFLPERTRSDPGRFHLGKSAPPPPLSQPGPKSTAPPSGSPSRFPPLTAGFPSA